MYWNKGRVTVSGKTGPVVVLPDPIYQDEIDGYANPAITSLDEIGSFKSYCIGQFGYEWINSVRLAVSKHRVPLGKVSPTVRNPDYQDVTEAEIIRVEFSRLDRNRLYADAVIAAEIDITSIQPDTVIHDAISQWYRIRSLITVTPDGYSIVEGGIAIYDKHEADPGLPLSEYLVPVLNTSDIEEEANELLRKYYPEALLEPVAIDAERLAERMGLTVVDASLVSASDDLLMGQSIFYDGLVRVKNNEAVVNMPVHAGTILINNECGMDAVQRGSTIIHECCHHYEHDLFVWAQKLYKDDAVGIECPVNPGAGSSSGESPLFWAERQARLMTYRIKMNRIQTERKVHQLTDAYRSSHKRVIPGNELEWVIRKVADTFHTSRECARNRMEELGFEKVHGVLNYVNGEYIPPYFFGEGILQKGQTFVIGIREAMEEYGRNENFREVIGSGFYVYVEGKFCLNKGKFVRRNTNGALRMTEYARTHTEECCLRFAVVYRDNGTSYEWGQFNRSAKRVEVGGKSIVVPQNAAEPGLGQEKEFGDMIRWATNINRAIAPLNFPETLVYLMKDRKMTLERLEEMSLISTRTIKRMRNDEHYTVSSEQVVALSVGMKLPPIVSMELMRKAGIAMKNNILHNTYGMVLSVMYAEDINTVNNFLVSLNFSPLSELAMAM